MPARARSASSDTTSGITRAVSIGIRKCFSPRHTRSRRFAYARYVNPSQRKNEFTVRRVGNQTMIIPRAVNCLTIGSNPPGDRRTSFRTRCGAATA